jgi:lipopolysaccharide transport system permease protein
MIEANEEEKWDITLKPRIDLFQINLKEVWRYRDLMFLMVKRDFIAFYKQTILGPIWFVIQPIFTTITFVFIFGNLAKISTEGVPSPLFYLCSISAWTFFSECLTKTSGVFRDNASIFGKVYFPRLIMPLSIILSTLVKFAIQLFMIIIFLIYYYFNGYSVNFSEYIFLLPVVIGLMSLQGLGFGMIISAMTTKYRDLALLLTFGIQLLMYATPIAYPLSSLNGNVRFIIQLNPLSNLIEGFRKCILNCGGFTLYELLISTITTIIILVLGLIIFNKVEKNFVDTI